MCVCGVSVCAYVSVCLCVCVFVCLCVSLCICMWVHKHTDETKCDSFSSTQVCTVTPTCWLWCTQQRCATGISRLWTGVSSRPAQVTSPPSAPDSKACITWTLFWKLSAARWRGRVGAPVELRSLYSIFNRGLDDWWTTTAMTISGTGPALSWPPLELWDVLSKAPVICWIVFIFEAFAMEITPGVTEMARGKECWMTKRSCFVLMSVNEHSGGSLTSLHQVLLDGYRLLVLRVFLKSHLVACFEA